MKGKKEELECGISVGCILYTGNSIILKQSNSFRMMRLFLSSEVHSIKSQQLPDTHCLPFFSGQSNSLCKHVLNF